MDASSFSKQLALALREAEDAPVPVDKEQILYVTYQKLCHDDPSVGITAFGCAALHDALIHATNSFALCNRLVDGIRQCCYRHTASHTASISLSLQRAPIGAAKTMDASDQQIDGAAPDDQEDNENGDRVTHGNLFALTEEVTESTISTLAGAYVQLAWAVHVTIPLECCRTADRHQATSYLGSYTAAAATATATSFDTVATTIESQSNQRDNVPIHDLAERIPAPNVDDDDHDIEENVATNGHDPGSSNGMDRENGHDVDDDDDDDDDDDSLVEVFATQSDSSDYEFESEYQVEANLKALNEWALCVEQSFDPMHLSKPVTSSWDATVQGVSELLSSLTHSEIAALPRTEFLRLHGADQLTQLCLALLVPNSSLHSPVLTSPLLTTDHWQRLGTHVVHTFRDCIMAYVPSEPDSLEDYLRLIRILLKVDQNVTVISPATWVGLSSLSALCIDIRTSKDNTLLNCSTLRILHAFIMDAADDLADLLEKSSQTNADDVMALQWSCLSLFQLLATSMERGKHGHVSIANDRAQLLLNSGLFRQWLLYWSRTEDVDYRILVQGVLLDLCFESPLLLGKYAWRFPDLAATVTASNEEQSTTNQSLLSRMLWNLFGIHILTAESGSSTLKVQWKSKAGDTHSTPIQRAVTLESCQESSWTLFAAMCSRSKEILTDWKLRREHKLSSPSTTAPDMRKKLWEQVEVLNDWDRLASRLSSPLVRSLFLGPMIPAGINVKADVQLRHELQPILHVLSHWPSVDLSLTRKPDVEDVEDTTEHRAAHLPVLFPLEEEEAVRSVRKAIKAIVSVLESTTTTDSASQQQERYSSKAD